MADELDPPTAADAGSPPVADRGAADESGRVDDFRAVAAQVYGESFTTISRYRDILASRGIDWGLLGPREVDRLWDRHILNSAAVVALIASRATAADVGAGAGLPGIPIAVLRPDLTVDLVEPLLRRSNFLTHTVNDLGISDRVTVRRARAEDVGRTYDVVLSRALAPLDRLIRWCLPLMKPRGEILAIKGASASEEVDRHAPLIAGSGLAAEVLSVSCDARVDPTTVVRLRLR